MGPFRDSVALLAAGRVSESSRPGHPVSQSHPPVLPRPIVEGSMASHNPPGGNQIVLYRPRAIAESPTDRPPSVWQQLRLDALRYAE